MANRPSASRFGRSAPPTPSSMTRVTSVLGKRAMPLRGPRAGGPRRRLCGSVFCPAKRFPSSELLRNCLSQSHVNFESRCNCPLTLPSTLTACDVVRLQRHCVGELVHVVGKRRTILRRKHEFFRVATVMSIVVPTTRKTRSAGTLGSARSGRPPMTRN